jgi:hypothetical protein
MGVQEVRWEKGGTEQSEFYVVFSKKEIKITS